MELVLATKTRDICYFRNCKGIMQFEFDEIAKLPVFFTVFFRRVKQLIGVSKKLLFLPISGTNKSKFAT